MSWPMARRSVRHAGPALPGAVLVPPGTPAASNGPVNATVSASIDVEMHSGSTAAERVPSGAEKQSMPSRAHLRSVLKEVELVRSTVGEHSPPWLAEHLDCEIADTKHRLAATRPPGVRLDGLKGVIGRSEKRLASTEQALADALATRDAAQQELEDFRNELAALEAELASSASGSFSEVGILPSMPPELVAMQQEMARMALEMQVERQRHAQERQQLAAILQSHGLLPTFGNPEPVPAPTGAQLAQASAVATPETPMMEIPVLETVEAETPFPVVHAPETPPPETPVPGESHRRALISHRSEPY